MNFAYSTNAFKKNPLEEAIREIKNLGYSGLELMADRPHLYPPDYIKADGKPGDNLHALRDLIHSTGLQTANINAFMLCAIESIHRPSWIEADKKRRDIRIRHTADSLRVAAFLGCPSISTEPGGPVEDMTEEEAMELFISGIREVIPLARKLGVKILVEPEPDLLIETSSQFGLFIKEIDDPIVGMNCDIGHFQCVEEDPAEVILNYREYIYHVHIEDIKGRIHEHKICGKGDIDYVPVFDALKEIDYRGFITVELYPYETTPVEAGRESLLHLEQFI